MPLQLPERMLTNWIHASTGLGVLGLCELILHVHMKTAKRTSSEMSSAYRIVSEVNDLEASGWQWAKER